MIIPKRLIVFIVWITLLPVIGDGATDITISQVNTGTIRGRITDAVTSAPVAGARIELVDTPFSTTADSDGRFIIESVPLGNYVAKVGSMAYHPQYIPDIIMQPGKTTYIYPTLQYRPYEMEGTSVYGNYFSDKSNRQASTLELSYQEIRRAPGAAGDISRTISIHPGIAKVDDMLNNLFVRGGSPAENGFYVDNIEIFNINHFPENASSGGGYALLHSDFIRNVTFSAGGFSVAYGNKLSSVTEITLREGNREAIETRLDVNLAGAGIISEGPLKQDRAFWLFSARRSFLDLMADRLEIDLVPRFSDYQTKLVFDLTARDRLSCLAIYGRDLLEFEKDRSLEKGMSSFGKIKNEAFTVGINWQHLFSSSGSSNTSLAITSNNHLEKFIYLKSKRIKHSIDNYSRSVHLRNITVFRLTDAAYFKCGLDGKLINNDYHITNIALANPIGGIYPSGTYINQINSGSAGVFAELTLRPLSRITTTFGMRHDYFEYSLHHHWSPRFSSTFQIGSGTFINGSAGVYYQSLPQSMYGTKNSPRDLKDPSAYHYILGLNHLLTKALKITVEGYVKQYRNFPLDPSQPSLFIMDGLIYWGFLGHFDDLVDDGRARSYGFEITLQKRLVSGFFGIICGAYSKTEYLGLDDIWRDRAIDNRLTVGIEGGYRPDNKWQFGLRWVFAGGRPFTPLDLNASKRYNITIFNTDRINGDRYPDYHVLSLRLERSFHFRHSSLSVYLAVFNLYDRENIYQYYWNQTDRQLDTIDQFGFLPLLGLELEL